MEESFTNIKKTGNESSGKSYRKMGSSNNECLIANNSEQPVMEPEEQGEEVLKTFPQKGYLLKSQVVEEPPAIVIALKDTQMTTAARNVQVSIADTVSRSFETIEEAGRKRIKQSSSITNGEEPTPIVPDEEPLTNQSQSQLSLQSSSAISSGTTAPVKPNVPDHLERKERYQLERNKQLLEYRYQQKEMIFTPIFNNKSGSPLTLGSGQFGTVIALRNLSTYQKVAMKEIKCRNDKEREDALREVKIHQQLQHENIIKFINHCEINNTIQILMETVSSGSMAKCLSVWGCLEEKVISHYLRQVLCAIEHMHDRGIVHLDIKGDNILVNEETACCKLVDFGCAHILKEADLSRPLGTINFMAPEVIVSSPETSSKEAKTYGKPADVWSIGCTAIEMANGKRPYYEYDSKSIISILYTVGTEKSHPPFPLNASRKFVDFLERCFCPEPLDRRTVLELLLHPFILRGKVVEEKLKDEPVENVCEAMIEEERQGEEELIQNDNPSIEKSPLAASPQNQSSFESQQLQASSFCTDNIIPSTVFHTEVALPRNDVNSGLCYHPYTPIASSTEDFNNIDLGKKDNKIKNPQQQETMWTDGNEDYYMQEELSFDENESLLLWLQNIGVPMSEIHKFCIHQCNLHDVLYNLQFDDLKDMEISVGPRARIWNAMQEHRHKQALVFGLELSNNC